MRHSVAGYRLGRTKSARIALRRNLIKQLFTHERIQTTKAKAAAILNPVVANLDVSQRYALVGIVVADVEPRALHTLH